MYVDEQPYFGLGVEQNILVGSLLLLRFTVLAKELWMTLNPGRCGPSS